MDQASTLRRIIDDHRNESRPPAAPERPMRVIAVTSGKGGVGKTNIVLNLSLALSRLQRRVFVMDADMGLANVDVLLGLTPRYTLEHVLSGQKHIMEVVVEGPEGVKILPATSGISELSEMSYEQQMQLFQALSRIDAEMDYLLVDTGAGISTNVLRFNASASEVVVVANPEPTAITDAYALMKLLAIKYHIRDFALIANSVNNEAEGRGVYDRLERVCTQFLQVRLRYLGPVPFDPSIRKAVRAQQPLLTTYPNSPAGKSISRIAALLDRGESPPPAPAASAALPHASFWDRLLHWTKPR